MWQGREVEGPPEPLQPPSPEVLSKSHVKMPSTAFEARYDSQDLPNGFKVEDDQGRIRVVSNFRQGFTGRAVERYPSGETYTGDFVDARRHGRGQFMDADGDGLMVSHFKKGRPVGEGTKFHQPWTNPSATRTFDGKEGASIPMKEASKIIKNLKTTSTIPVPVAQGFSAAVRAAKASTPPPKPKHRPKVEYVSESKGAFKPSTVEAFKPQPDAFLAKLEAAEQKPISVVEARRSLVPHVG